MKILDRDGFVMFRTEVDESACRDGEVALLRATIERAVRAGVDLSGADLTGADLAWADLAGAKMVFAQLDEACLVGANLAGADLAYASLRSATLRGANLTEADLSFAGLGSAMLRGACLIDARLKCANLQRANLSFASMEGADLQSATLSEAIVTQACLAAAMLSFASLRDADLTSADLSGATLARADLLGAKFTAAILIGASLAETSSAGAIFEDALVPKEWSASCHGAIATDLESGVGRLGRLTRQAARYRVRHPEVPVIEDLDARILEVIEAGQGRMRMSGWHDHGDACGTTHCRAGWAIALAGDVGRALEARWDRSGAGAMLYRASTGRVPDFYARSEAEAIDDLRRCAQAFSPGHASARSSAGADREG